MGLYSLALLYEPVYKRSLLTMFLSSWYSASILSRAFKMSLSLPPSMSSRLYTTIAGVDSPKKPEIIHVQLFLPCTCTSSPHPIPISENAESVPPFDNRIVLLVQG